MSGKRRVDEKWLRLLDWLAVPLLVISLAAVVLGGHDAVVGARFGQRLLGSLLLLAGVALLVAWSLFFRVLTSSSNEPAEKAAADARLSMAPVLFLVGAVPGLLLFALQVSAFAARGFEWRFDWRLLLWLFGAIVPLIAAYGLWPIHTTERFGRVSKVIGLLSAAGLIGAGQTFLTSYYEPVKRGDSLSLTTQLVPDDVVVLPAGKDRRSMQALRGTVSIENAGDARLVFLGGMYLITGVNVSPRSVTDVVALSQSVPKELDPKELDRSGNFGVDLYDRNVKWTPVKQALLYDPGTNWIAAGSKVQLDFLTYVPKNEFQRYVGAVTVVTARGDRMHLRLGRERRSSYVGPKDMPGVTRRADLTETSWVNWVTRRRLDVSITHTLFPPYPYVFACFHPANTDVSFQTCLNRAGSPRMRRLRDSYGLNVFTAWSSLQMPFPSS